MIMDVDNLHVLFAGMNGAAMLTSTATLVAIELFKHRRQILDDTLQLDFRAINQLMAVRAVPLEGVQ
jgi:hypothetical protein